MIRQLELRLAGICSLGITEGDGVVRSSETIPRGCANGCWRARHVVASKGSLLSSARERRGAYAKREPDWHGVLLLHVTAPSGLSHMHTKRSERRRCSRELFLREIASINNIS